MTKPESSSTSWPIGNLESFKHTNKMTSLASIESTLIDAVDVPAGGLALLAFVMALYLLAAREQKTPYITNSVYSTALIVLFAIFCSTIGKVLNSAYPDPALIFRVLGLVIFVLGILNVLFTVWHVRNRKLNFRDDRLVKSLRFVRLVKHLWRRVRAKPSYEHDPIGFTELLLTAIKGCRHIPSEQFEMAVTRKTGHAEIELSLSAGCGVSNFAQADEFIADIAVCFLEQRCWVQYTSCARHPIEFILYLRKAWQAKHKDRDWKTVAGHIVAADVYSPHFGFTDSIHDEVTDRMTDLGVDCITAKASYAGLHSAAAKAFNRIKTGVKHQQGSSRRLPTLVVYEAPYALVDLESMEQYRIFIRHLLPSERLWGGMFTLVVESGIKKEELVLLKSYTDVFVDLSQMDERSGAETERNKLTKETNS